MDLLNTNDIDLDELLNGNFLTDNSLDFKFHHQFKLEDSHDDGLRGFEEQLGEAEMMVLESKNEEDMAIEEGPMMGLELGNNVQTTKTSSRGRQIGQKCKREFSSSPMSFMSHEQSAVSSCSSSSAAAGTTAATSYSSSSPSSVSIPGARKSDGAEVVSMMKAAPRVALAADLARLQVPSSSTKSEFMTVTTQPPLEVRTRTKNENRTFNCNVQVNELPSPDYTYATVQLCYATDTNTIIDTMGGTLKKPIVNQTIVFDDLSVSVASPKHSEKEFVLKITLGGDRVSPEESQHCVVFSTPFYAYSHKSVLKRRREVTLMASSHEAVSTRGSQRMHVVGTPFVRSDRLQCVFRVRRRDCERKVLDAIQAMDSKSLMGEEEWISVRSENMEFFSESVLFFNTPQVFEESCSDVQAYMQVTNDGRNFSNPLPVLFIADGPPSPKRQAIRSRM